MYTLNLIVGDLITWFVKKKKKSHVLNHFGFLIDPFFVEDEACDVAEVLDVALEQVDDDDAAEEARGIALGKAVVVLSLRLILCAA